MKLLNGKFQTLKSNTKTRSKMFLDNIRRVYRSVFEQRSIEEIQNDYYGDLWISKSDLLKMYEFEKAELYRVYSEIMQDHNDLKQSFNLNALANYKRLEKQQQGKLAKSFKPVK